MPDGLVFVSYRRADTRDIAGRLADRLMDRFGDDQVFLDVVAIAPGIDFVSAIEQAIKVCRVTIVVIGSQWLTLPGPSGRPRIEDPFDPLRVEVRTSFTSGIPVLPVLVDDAIMPRAEQLPEDMRRLARIAAARLSHESFRADAARIVEAINRISARTLEPAAAVASTPRTRAPRAGRGRGRGRLENVEGATIRPGQSVRGVPLGATAAEVARAFGDPTEVRSQGPLEYFAYPRQGLEVSFRQGRSSGYFLYAAGPAQRYVREAFRGTTPEGISVASRRLDVEAAYGESKNTVTDGPDEICATYRGLKIWYASRYTTDLQAEIAYMAVVANPYGSDTT